MKVLHWIVDLALSMILFEEPKIYAVVAIEISEENAINVVNPHF